MITFKQYIEKFPTTEDFEKAFPPGTKIKWVDRDTWHIVSYSIDTYKNGKLAHLVVIKSWSKYKQRWCYEVHHAFEIYSINEMLTREAKEEAKLKKKENV